MEANEPREGGGGPRRRKKRMLWNAKASEGALRAADRAGSGETAAALLRILRRVFVCLFIRLHVQLVPALAAILASQI